MSKISSWSFSFLQVFESCAYRAKLARIDKIPDNQPKTAADRGTAIHLEAENYVIGKGDFTHNLRFFQDDLTALQRHYAAGRVICEEEWGYSRDWTVAGWKSAWLRLKLDALCMLTPQHAVAIDYKTGKRFGNEIKHAEQLQLYALCTLIRYPEVEKVTTELWYFDQNELASFEMKRSQIGKFLRIFDRRGRAVTEATDFKPNPNIHSCKYCPYHKDRQGDCKFGIDLTPRSVNKPVELIMPTSMKASKFDFSADLKRFEKS